MFFQESPNTLSYLDSTCISFPIAVITNYYKIRGLRQHHFFFFSQSSGSQKSKMSLTGLKEGISKGRFLLVAAGKNLFLVSSNLLSWASGPFLCPSGQLLNFFKSLSACPSDLLPPSYMIPMITSDPLHDPGYSPHHMILNLITSAQSLAI